MTVSVSGNPLLFTKATVLDSRTHKRWKITPLEQFDFCSSVRVLPITLSEFPRIALEQPIVFVQDDDLVVPVAVVGLRAEVNLFVDDSGLWNGRYIPAYVRMYPFILAPRRGRKGYSVCIDADYSGFGKSGGTRLFKANGDQSEFTNRAIAFATEYQKQREESLVFTAALKDLGLLAPASLVEERDSLDTVGGFMTVNREKLLALETAELKRLFTQGHIEASFLHLASLTNFETLISLTERRLASQ